MRSAILLAAAATALAGMYDGTSVVQLDDSNFASKVLKDSGIWLVEVRAAATPARRRRPPRRPGT